MPTVPWGTGNTISLPVVLRLESSDFIFKRSCQWSVTESLVKDGKFQAERDRTMAKLA